MSFETTEISLRKGKRGGTWKEVRFVEGDKVLIPEGTGSSETRRISKSTASEVKVDWTRKTRTVDLIILGVFGSRI